VNLYLSGQTVSALKPTKAGELPKFALSVEYTIHRIFRKDFRRERNRDDLLPRRDKMAVEKMDPEKH
jgi:hypothetical protein